MPSRHTRSAPLHLAQITIQGLTIANALALGVTAYVYVRREPRTNIRKRGSIHAYPLNLAVGDPTASASMARSALSAFFLSRRCTLVAQIPW